MRLRPLVLGIASLYLAACSLLLADELENGSRPSDVDGGLPDAFASDVAVSDAMAVSDAGTDAAPKQDGGPARFCDRDATFCEDFDTPDGALGASWTTLEQYRATLSFDEVAFSTSPRSLSAYAPVSEAGSRRARLEKFFPGSANHVRCEFALRVDATSGAGPYPFNVEIENATLEEYGVFFNTTPSDSLVQEFAGLPDGGRFFRNSYTGASFVGTKWRKVVIEIALPTEGVSGSFSLTIDGSSIYTNRPLALAYVPRSGIRVTVGHCYDGEPDVSQLHIDDIACDLSP